MAAFEHRLEDNLLAAARGTARPELSHPARYTSFYIHEPKRRLISAAPFRDRVVHHALCNLIEPIFERSFIADSYANRVGKGTHRAHCPCASSLHVAIATCCNVTCEQFFPSIDHAILRGILARKLDDRSRALADRQHPGQRRWRAERSL
ncbi:MAG: hypothetical protein V9G10_13525 [Candidatus Nanopelagicales bacterium]